MNLRDRRRLRKTQDAYVRQAVKRGLQMDTPTGLTCTNGVMITLQDVADYLYPEYESAFHAAL